MKREDQFIPHLIVSDGMAALKFYKDVFGAEEGHNLMAPDGKRLMHGELSVDGHKFLISDEFSREEGGNCSTPQTLGGTSVRITMMTDDADGVVERAIARGAKVVMPVQDMFWGARYGQILDPFGHNWGINQQLKEQTEEETNAAAAEFFAKPKLLTGNKNASRIHAEKSLRPLRLRVKFCFLLVPSTGAALACLRENS
jgi:PhnB protein